MTVFLRLSRQIEVKLITAQFLSRDVDEGEKKALHYFFLNDYYGQSLQLYLFMQSSHIQDVVGPQH